MRKQVRPDERLNVALHSQYNNDVQQQVRYPETPHINRGWATWHARHTQRSLQLPWKHSRTCAHSASTWPSS